METWLYRDGVFNVSKAVQFKVDLIQFYLRIARRGDAVTVLTLDAASGAERPRPEGHFPNLHDGVTGISPVLPGRGRPALQGRYVASSGMFGFPPPIFSRR